jgi:cold shock CspA family protein
MKIKGRVSTFFQSRGFGFINASVDGRLVSYFFHISACLAEPQINAEVLFTPGISKKGPLATEIEVGGVQ